MSQPTRNITSAEKSTMQRTLKYLGLYHDEIDGRWGSNSVAAMKQWQAMQGAILVDGIPTYGQMVALGAAVPEVIPARRSSSGVPFLGNLLLNAIPFFFGLLPKVNLPMNPLLVALGRINKATIAAIVGFAATIFLLFGIEIAPDTQGILITLGTAVITGIITWLVPNAAPAPAVAQGILNTSLAKATPVEYSEWANLAGGTIEPYTYPQDAASDTKDAGDGPAVPRG